MANGKGFPSCTVCRWFNQLDRHCEFHNVLLPPKSWIICRDFEDSLPEHNTPKLRNWITSALPQEGALYKYSSATPPRELVLLDELPRVRTER